MKLTPELVEKLQKPLPPEAIKPHPTKPYLSSINAIYVTERLNEVFGTGEWKVSVEVIDSQDKMVTVKVTFTVDEYDIHLEQFGGNDNADKGDALKGATTDAITKIGSYLGIGADVWKGKVEGAEQQKIKKYDPDKKWYTKFGKGLDDKQESKLTKLLEQGKTNQEILDQIKEVYNVSKEAEEEILNLKTLTQLEKDTEVNEGQPF